MSLSKQVDWLYLSERVYFNSRIVAESWETGRNKRTRVRHIGPFETIFTVCVVGPSRSYGKPHRQKKDEESG